MNCVWSKRLHELFDVKYGIFFFVLKATFSMEAAVFDCATLAKLLFILIKLKALTYSAINQANKKKKTIFGRKSTDNNFCKISKFPTINNDKWLSPNNTTREILSLISKITLWHTCSHFGNTKRNCNVFFVKIIISSYCGGGFTERFN